MELYRVLMSGSGGQGVITMAIVLAEAACLYEGLTAIQSQSYGPEARGGATRSDVIIADGPIFFPKVMQPNFLVALTNEASNKYLPLIRPGGICLYDTDLVQLDLRVDARPRGLPMYSAVIREFGKAQSFNICVLGALTALIGAVVSLNSLEQVLLTRFGPSRHENNCRALRLGAEMAAPMVDA
ncbi:MAG: 2-oxoacid:acceptor oxidoreductase family protein [Desulfovibrio sp.]|jgi:2-oxoglutarate ferredoxin oxidoreductase subunit gamma|nr:2-oxoacid:acceptor oxidoreductase family protein [Desulfovibrio sp.]